jgi:hypothetical protein
MMLPAGENYGIRDVAGYKTGVIERISTPEFR